MKCYIQHNLINNTHIFFINFKIDNKFCGKSHQYYSLVNLLNDLISYISYEGLYNGVVQIYDFTYRMSLNTDSDIAYIEYIKCLRNFIDENI